MEPETEKVKEYYDTFLASEPGKYSSLDEFNARYEPVLAFFKKQKACDIRILDVGCGTGMTAEKLKVFGTVCGVDISPESTKQAQTRLDEAYVCGADQTGFPNGTFNAVVCTETIEHVPSPELAISEFNRVLKTGGHLIISTPNPRYWLVLLIGFYAWFIGRKTRTGQIMEHYLSPSRLQSLVKKGGFAITEYKTVFFRPAFLERVSNRLGLYQICIAEKLKEVN